MLPIVAGASSFISFNGEPDKTRRLFPEIVAPMAGLVLPGQELRVQFVNFKLAAFRGDPNGMLGLANMYLQGSFELQIAQDFISAEYWFWQALRYDSRNLGIFASIAGIYVMGAGALASPNMHDLLNHAVLGNVGARIEITNILNKYIPRFPLTV